jgi:uncharacterized membrane-anchored protein
MATLTCNHCGAQVITGQRHNCPDNDFDDIIEFGCSAVIGAVTDSAILGGLAGG